MMNEVLPCNLGGRDPNDDQRRHQGSRKKLAVVYFSVLTHSLSVKRVNSCYVNFSKMSEDSEGSSRFQPRSEHIDTSASRATVGSKESKGLENETRVWAPDYSGKYVHAKAGQNREDIARQARANAADYDPYKHRKFKAQIGNFATLIHLMKGCIGTGVWEMPYSFKNAGLALGTVGTVFVAAFISYGFNLLMKTEYLMCKRKRVPYLSYGESMQYAMEEGPDWMIRYAKLSRKLVNLAIVIYQIGACTIYMAAVSKMVKAMLDETSCDVMSVRALLSSFLVLFFLLVFIPDMKTYAWFSGLAFVLTMASAGLVTYYGFTIEPVPGPRSMTGHPEEWPSFLFIMMFGMHALGVTTVTERNMARPHDFVGFFGMMNVNVMLTALIYWALGFCGYWVYGEETKGNVMGNMPSDHPYIFVVQIFQSIAVFISFGLQNFPTMHIVWDEYLTTLLQADLISSTKKLIYNYTMRISIVVFIYAVSMAAIDTVMIIIYLVIVLNVGLCGFAFPAMMHICYLWPDNFGRFNWVYYKDLFVFVMGLGVLTIGVYMIVDSLLQESSPAAGCSTPPPTENSTIR